jgi:hypothetical protein
MRLSQILGVYILLATAFAAAPAKALAAEEAIVATENKLNVRGKPSLIGEIITQLESGEKVTVLERITNSAASPGEPTNWAKIKLPPNTPVWVFSPFVKDGVVNVSRLNVRAGRGENYSVIGRLNRGEEVKPIRTVEEWMEIEQPTNAYAFVDLDLLQIEGEAPKIRTETTPVVANAPTTETALPTTNVPPTTASAETGPKVETLPQAGTNDVVAASNVAKERSEPIQPTEINTPPENTTDSTREGPTVASPPVATAPETTENETAETKVPSLPEGVETTIPETASTAPTNNTPVLNSAPVATSSALPQTLPEVAPPIEQRTEPAGKRIVRREGIVRPTASIQAPTWYELVHADTKKRINYLFADGMDINLKDYRGQKVVVTGEEAIDSRWPNTPILDMQTLDVLP